MTEREKAQPDAAESAGVSRREFVTRTAAAGAGLVIVPRHVLGRGFQAPSDTVNIATVGVSGMGSSNTNAVMSQNIVAFCDVDFGLLDNRIDRWKKQAAASPAKPRQSGRGRARGSAASRRPRSSPRTRSGRARHERRRPCSASSTSSCPRSRSTATTARCSRSRRTSTRSSSPRPITCTPDRARRRWTSASTSTCRSRSAGRSRKRVIWRRRRRTSQGRHADGQPGPLARRSAPRLRVHHVGRHRRRPRSARLDQPPAGLLAAGRAASGAAARGDAAGRRRQRGGAGVESTRARGGARRQLSRRPISCRGICSSASRRRSSITRSITPSTGAAGSTGARARSATWART